MYVKFGENNLTNQSMETVFDYNITDKERENIGISDKERYLAIV